MSLEKNLDLPEIILRMGNPSAREVYEFDDFRLDAGHLMLYHKEEEVALVPKAVELLIALVERRGEIISKDELLEKVWPDAIVDESNLFFYLSLLRKTLGSQKNGKPWFETLKRRGYKFSGEVRLLSVDGNGGPVPLRSLHSFPNNARETRDTADSVERRDERPLHIGRSVYAAAGLIIIVLAASFAFQYVFAKRPIKSIAVMPFGNDNPDLVDVLDGMTINVIGSLSKIPDLDVKASSTMLARYKVEGQDAAKVGRDLGVDAVLASRMVQSGNDLTLDVELVDSRTENVLWQQRYSKKTSDLGTVQHNLIRDVVGELNLDVTDVTKQRLAKDYSESAEATQLYLKGQYHIRRLTGPDIRKGLEYLRQATRHDPNYAPAYAAIAMGIRSITLCCDGHPSDFVEAKKAAQRAVELNDDLAEAHTALASSLYQNDWNFDEAEKEYERAIEINPNSGITHFLYADFLGKMRTDRRDEAKAHRARAIELEPYSAYFNAFAMTDEPGKELERAQFTISLDPDAYFSHLMAAPVYSKKKMYAEAIEEYRTAKNLAPEQTWSDIFMSRLYKEMGQIDQSRAILNAMVERSKSHYVPPFHLAQMYSQFGETEKVIHYLEEGYRVRDPKMPFLNTMRSWGGAENDPRFQSIVQRIGVPEKAEAAVK